MQLRPPSTSAPRVARRWDADPRGAVRLGPLTHRSRPQGDTSPRYRTRLGYGARHQYRARRSDRGSDLTADLFPASRLAATAQQRAILLREAVRALARLPEPLRGRFRSTLSSRSRSDRVRRRRCSARAISLPRRLCSPRARVSRSVSNACVPPTDEMLTRR